MPRQPRSRTIGVLFPHVPRFFASAYFLQLLDGIADELLGTSYRMKLLLLPARTARSDRYAVRTDGVSGVILTQWFRMFPDASVFKRWQVPCVIINDEDPGVPARCVTADNRSGGVQVAKHLWAKGHRRVGIVLGPAWSSDGRRRAEGFQAVMRAHDAPVDTTCIVRGDFDNRTVTRRAVDRLLAQRPRVTAVFCCNDTMALMTLERLRERRISCPRALSVVGFDNDQRAVGARPALTTVQLPARAIGQRAARVLVRQLDRRRGARTFVGCERLPVTLIARDSVARVRR